MTATVFATVALQAAGAFAGGHSNHNGNLTRKNGVSASRQIAPPKRAIHHPIDFPTAKPKGLAGLGRPAKGGQLGNPNGSKGQTIAADGPDIGGWDTLHDIVGAIFSAIDPEQMAQWGLPTGD
ncbi:MAG: hypothetical protein HY288_17505 [Planctomycetia bacterium]|nr:hypothetical protein [Planctomycetia bacterium]